MSDNKGGVKDVFISCADSSTLHGLPKIASSRQLAVKGLWCFILLGALGICTYQIYELITTYYTFPVQTSISLHHSMIDFPAITICNENPVRLSKSVQDDDFFKLLYGASSGQKIAALDTILDVLNNNDTDDRNVDSYYVWQDKVMATFREFEPEVRKAMGHQVESFIHSAKFGGYKYLSSDFNLTLSPVYGNCYTLDIEDLHARKTGPRQGLQLVLNLENEEYIDHFTSGAGARVVIHERNTLPHPEENGISLSPGYETNIALKLIQLERLGPPYGDCSDSNSVDNGRYIYTTQNCQQKCAAQFAIDTCECMPYTTQDEYDLESSICQTDNEIACIRDLYEDQCDCESRCSEKEYTSVISGRQWPGIPFLNRVIMKESCDKNISSMESLCSSYKKDNVTAENFWKFANNFVAVNIYFEQLNYEKIREQPLYDPISLLSDIGGTMSFYLGASVLTYLELFQFILELILYCRHSCSRPKTHPGKDKLEERQLAHEV